MTPEQVQKRWNGYDDAQRNAWVAVSVMGWKVRGVQTRMGYIREYRKPDQQRESDWIQGIPEFTTDHNHAHEALATTLAYGGFHCKIETGAACGVVESTIAISHHHGFYYKSPVVPFDTAPAAISLACLMARECKESTDD